MNGGYGEIFIQRERENRGEEKEKADIFEGRRENEQRCENERREKFELNQLVCHHVAYYTM